MATALALMEHGGSCGCGILVVMLLLVREYKYGGGFDAGDCDGDDGGCNNGFDGDGTMPMASTTAVLVVRE